MGRHDDAFAGIFVAHTGIHIPTLHEVCRETLNPHISMGTSNLNMQVVFVSYRVFLWRLFHFRVVLETH